MTQQRNMMQNTDAERYVLSACLTNEALFADYFERLTDEMFSDAQSRRVYDIIRQVIREGRRPDVTEVGMRYIAQGGDMAAFIATDSPSYELTGQRIALLEELAVRRNIYGLSYRIMAMSNDPTATIDDIQRTLSTAEQVLTGTREEDIVTFGDAARRLCTDVADRMGEDVERGMMTGLHVFDSRYGFHGGDLVVVAGETSQGKSTLATTIARNMAVSGIPCAYYSMEMSAQQLTARIMARDTCISSSRTLYGRLNANEYAVFHDTSLRMGSLPIYFDEKNKTSVRRICRSVKRLVRLYGVRVVFVDYLQIMANGSRTDSREQMIGDMARDFKVLAVETGVCVVVVSQLSRPSDGRSHEPTLSRMRGSGQIEEACDTAVLVYRPEVYGVKRWAEGMATEGTAKLYIKKGRNIGIGEEIVHFNSSLSFFEDYDPTTAEAGGYQEQREELPF